MKTFERRGLVMLVVVALLLLRAISVFPTPVWLIVIYCLGLACLTAASLMLVVVVAPEGYIGRWDSERARLVFFAFALLVADVFVAALIAAYSAAVAHPIYPGFGL